MTGSNIARVRRPARTSRACTPLIIPSLCKRQTFLSLTQTCQPVGPYVARIYRHLTPSFQVTDWLTWDNPESVPCQQCQSSTLALIGYHKTHAIFKELLLINNSCRSVLHKKNYLHTLFFLSRLLQIKWNQLKFFFSHSLGSILQFNLY